MWCRGWLKIYAYHSCIRRNSIDIIDRKHHQFWRVAVVQRYISRCDVCTGSCGICAWSCRRRFCDVLLKQLKHSPSLHTMSEHCFGSLTSQRRRECEPLQNGHCDLPLASVVGFSAPMWNATVGRGGSTWGFACDPIFSTYSSLRTAACNSVMVHSPLPCVLFQFCLVLGGSFSRSISTSKLSCESFGFLRIVRLQMCPTVVS